MFTRITEHGQGRRVKNPGVGQFHYQQAFYPCSIVVSFISDSILQLPAPSLAPHESPHPPHHHMPPLDSTAKSQRQPEEKRDCSHTAKTQCRKFETNIPRKGIARLQSQLLHSCFCERFIYSPDQSAYSDAGQ